MEGAREVFPVAVRDLKTQTQFVIQGTVRHFLAGFIVERRSRGLAKRTVTYYESELRLFCEFLDDQGVMMLEDVTIDNIRQYLLVLGNTRNPGGIHAAFRAIRAFFIRHPKWNFGSHTGAAWSRGASPWARAKRRSWGRHSPSVRVTSSRLSAVRPFTG